MFWSRKYKAPQEGEGYTRVRTGRGEEARELQQKPLEKISEKAQQRKSGISLQLSYLHEHFTPSTINFLVSSYWL